jgi:HAD superfamily hydrolase (TIGR01549 family)
VVIQTLKENGFKVGLCSNLAQPYGQCLTSLLPEFDFRALSYELGLMKPMPEIYSAVCTGMNLEPSEILFVGDSKSCDYLGPVLAGMQALHLKRGQNGDSIATLRGVLGLLDIVL